MKNVIHKYLSAYYKIDLRKGEWNLYDDGNKRVRSRGLAKNLSILFGLREKKLKWYIKSWFYKQNKGFDFTRWWKPLNFISKKQFRLKYNNSNLFFSRYLN